MKIVAQIISWIALIGIIVPPCAYLANAMTLDALKLWMLIATLAWFVTVPVWMDRKEGS